MGKAIVRVVLDQGVADALDKVGNRRGMTQLSMMTRMVDWFSRQDPEIQRAILTAEGTNHAAASKILIRLAKHRNGGPKKSK
jgi:hypothetical protein